MFGIKRDINFLNDKVRNLEHQTKVLSSENRSLKLDLIQLKNPPSFEVGEKVLIDTEHYLLNEVKLDHNKWRGFGMSFMIYNYRFVNLNNGKTKILTQPEVNELFPDKYVTESFNL